MYKDQVYLIGAIEILKARKKIDFKRFHTVKMGVKDFLKKEKKKYFVQFRAVILDDEMIFPYFLKDLEKYQRKLDHIAMTNFII